MNWVGRTHELKRLRPALRIECSSHATAHVSPRAWSAILRPPNTTFQEKVGVVARRLLPTTKLLSALKEASRPQWYHRWAADGTLGPSVSHVPCGLDGPDALNLPGEGYMYSGTGQ